MSLRFCEADSLVGLPILAGGCSVLAKGFAFLFLTVGGGDSVTAIAAHVIYEDEV